MCTALASGINRIFHIHIVSNFHLENSIRMAFCYCCWFWMRRAFYMFYTCTVLLSHICCWKSETYFTDGAQHELFPLSHMLSTVILFSKSVLLCLLVGLAIFLSFWPFSSHDCN